MLPTTLDREDIPDLLASLVERSIVVCDPVTGRHSMTESMRVYADEQLSDEEEQETREKHFEYFQTYAENIFEHSRVFDEAQARHLFVPEIDNLRLAFEWAFIHNPRGCLHLIACAGFPWRREALAEAYQLLTRALASAPEVSDFDQVSARIQLARIRLRERALGEAGRLLAIARQQIEGIHDPDPSLRASLTLTSGVQQAFVGNREHARKLTLEVLDIAERYGLPWFKSAAHTNLGEQCREEEEYEAACRHYEEAILLTTDPLTLSTDLSNLGNAAIKLGDLARAEESFRRAYHVGRPTGDRAKTFHALGGLGYVFVRRGQYRKGGLLMGYSEWLRKKAGTGMDPIDEALFEEFRALGVELGGEVYENALVEGATLSNEQLSEIVDRTAP